MPVPPLIRERLAAADVERLPGVPADEACQGAKHHSPRPLVLHDVALPDGTTVLLCGTCQDNLQTLEFLRTAGPLDWPVRREFGNQIRALAGL